MRAHLRRAREAVPRLLRRGEPPARARPARTCCASSRAGWTTSSTAPASRRAATWRASSSATATSLVNGHKVDIPSYRVSDNDIIEVREKLARADAVRRRARRGRRASRPGVARGHPEPDAHPRALPPGPAGHRHAGPGAADRRALLEVGTIPEAADRRRLRAHHIREASNSGRPWEGQLTCSSHSAPPSPKRSSTTTARGSSSSRSSPASATRSATRLRRTLLSSIPGAAVTSIRIDGVLHEFTTVPGVKEDVTDIILNIKGLVVSSEVRRAGRHVPAQAGPRRRSPPPTSRRRPASRCTTPTCTSPR